MNRIHILLARLRASRYRVAVIASAVCGVAVIVMPWIGWFGSTTYSAPMASADELASPSSPEGIQMTTTHDFGVVVSGQDQLTHEFMCTNNGTRPIALRLLGQGCNCLEVACPAEIAPGESRPVRVTVETRGWVGPFRTLAHLGTSDPAVPQIDLEIRFSGVARVTVDPPALVFHNAAPGASLSAEFELIRVLPRNGGAPADVAVTTSNPAIRCVPLGAETHGADLRLGTATRRARRYAVHVETAQLPRDGRLRLSQEIVVDGGAGAKLHLPIEVVFRICLVAGLAAATRPVGLALLPPVAWHAWRTAGSSQGLARRGLRGLGAGLLAGWGLWVYMAFLWHHCDDPWAFAKAQAMANLRDEYPAPLGQQLLGAIILEPIWAVYVPSYHDYWARFDPRTNLLVNLQFANPIYFVTTAALVAVGWWKRRLTDYELLLSAGLLLIPYLTKAHGNAMASFGRFAIVVWPAYLVMGHLLRSLPRPVSVLILAVLAAMFTAYATCLALGSGIV